MAFLSTIPFWLHIVIELPASLNFLFNPAEQLPHPPPPPQTLAIIRQYAVLLLSSTLISLIFAVRRVDSTSRKVGGALAVYHMAPLGRAANRLMIGDVGYGKGLGGPAVHLFMHGICFLALIGLYAPKIWQKNTKTQKKVRTKG